MSIDTEMMQRALVEARRAEAIDEVPIGAVIAIGERVIAVAHNEREVAHDPTAHAEILALRRASTLLGRWRLDDATIYVTLEPCAMCAGALVNARVQRLVYGAEDPKAGGVRSLYRIADDPRLNHRMIVESGVLGEECGAILRGYFRKKRAAGAFAVRAAVVDDAAAIARVHVASWRTTYRGIIDGVVLDGLDVDVRRAQWAERIADGAFRVIVGARASGDIVAFAAFGPNREPPDRFVGELGAIYAIEEAQGRGLGRLLFSRAMEELFEMRLVPVIVWVLEANTGARAFYEAMGGVIAGERMIEIGGARYAELAYALRGGE